MGPALPASGPLTRIVQVEVDRTSWRLQPAAFRHPYPRALTHVTGSFPIHLLVLLQRLGELTTPALSPQSGVARLWPLLRYLHVVADTPAFRFRNGWRDVDPHQKGVASDDFGVGLGMAVLYGAFDYVACIDGRAFLHQLARKGLVAGKDGMPPKVGTMKMADYAAVDAAGKFHLIECKGTQHSSSALDKGMSDGHEQKLSLVCRSRRAEQRLIGQRLVVGTQLALESGTKPTRVVVRDPAPEREGPMVLASGLQSTILAEPAIRLEIARALGAAGADRTAIAIAEGDLQPDASVRLSLRHWERTQAAFAEDEAGLEAFSDFGDGWIGQRVVVPLMSP